MTDLATFSLIVPFVAACVAAGTDLWRFRVYNALTIPLAISGVCFHAFASGWFGVGQSMLGMLLGLGLLIIPYALGVMGAGDVKLLAALGSWLGLQLTVVAFVISALLLGVFATVQVILRGEFRQSWATVRLIFWRLAMLGSQFCKEDLVELNYIKPDRRLRLIPFAAAFPFGIIGAILWLRLFSGGA